MKRTVTSMRAMLSSVVLAILILFDTTPLYAQSNLHTDTSGYTTGTIGSNSVRIYRDRYGNTTGVDRKQAHNHLQRRIQWYDGYDR